MSEAENESKQKLEEASPLSFKADGDDQIVSRATDMSNPDAEDGTNHEESDQGPMLIIADEPESSLE